jgi:hypothetical protein
VIPPEGEHFTSGVRRRSESSGSESCNDYLDLNWTELAMPTLGLSMIVKNEAATIDSESHFQTIVEGSRQKRGKELVDSIPKKAGAAARGET